MQGIDEEMQNGTERQSTGETGQRTYARRAIKGGTISTRGLISTEQKTRGRKEGEMSLEKLYETRKTVRTANSAPGIFRLKEDVLNY